ncbi:MAG: hypothetical protein RQ729_12610, partial [Wenzhouxiangellaceae bacterium]|nr:hypothetical protein [Wenzhouxiangellaceae bacterium]
DRQNAENNKITGYNCNTNTTGQAYGTNYGDGTSYSYGTANSNTQCLPQRQGNYYGSAGVAISQGFAQHAQQSSAKEQAYNAVMYSCLAQAGWGFRKVCIENCKR